MKESKVLICNICAMDKYQGPEPSIYGGGSFIKKNGFGFEIFNFKIEKNNTFYGYVEIPRGSTHLNMARIAANTRDTVNNVTIIWVANSRIVGFYKNATVFAKRRQLPTPFNINGKNQQRLYFFQAPADQCYCIPVEERKFIVNRKQIMGRSNIRYTDNLTDSQKNYVGEMLKYINSCQAEHQFLILDQEEDEKYIQQTQINDNDECSIKNFIDKVENIPEKITINNRAVYKRNIKNGKMALEKSYYQCELNHTHQTFISRSTNKPYLEPHHLIPTSAQQSFANSLDVPANIVALCSSCHKEIHYGQNSQKLIMQLFEQRKNRLKNAGITITPTDILKYY